MECVGTTLPVGALHLPMQPITYEQQQQHLYQQQVQEQQQQIRLLVEQRRGDRTTSIPMHNAAPPVYVSNHQPPSLACFISLTNLSPTAHQSPHQPLANLSPTAHQPLTNRSPIAHHYPSEREKKNNRARNACTSSVKPQTPQTQSTKPGGRLYTHNTFSPQLKVRPRVNTCFSLVVDDKTDELRRVIVVV